MDKAEDGMPIAQLLKSEFPVVPVIARANDRRHSVDLAKSGVQLQVRETFESVMELGAAAPEPLEASQFEIAPIAALIRDRDNKHTARELEGEIDAGGALFRGKAR